MPSSTNVRYQRIASLDTDLRLDSQPMGSNAGVLTLPEVADFLRSDPGTVRQLLERGELAGFKVGGEWRILEVAVIKYLREQMEETQQEALERAITDPRMWARVLEEMPAEKTAWLREGAFEQGTMGAWLQDALRAEQAERSAENVVPFEPRRE